MWQGKPPTLFLFLATFTTTDLTCSRLSLLESVFQKFCEKFCWNVDWNSNDSLSSIWRKLIIISNSENFYPCIPSVPLPKSPLIPFSINDLLFSRKSSCALLYLFLGILYFLSPTLAVSFSVFCQCRSM